MWFSIAGVHALRLISQAGKTVCHCVLLGQLTQSNETSYRLTVWAVEDRSGACLNLS